MPNNLTTLSDMAKKIEKMNSFKELSKWIRFRDNGDGTISLDRRHSYVNQEPPEDAKYISAHELIYGGNNA